MRGPLALITAPAGFGKTTLAASYAETCGMPAAWLSLDKDDNQPSRFLSYLAAALQEKECKIGNTAAQLMAGMEQPANEAVLISVINDLDAAEGEMLLVLDDYHFISNPAVHEAVIFLLEHCPTRFHLTIVSRSDPPLPIARLRARGQIIELRAADLRFTEAEAAQFLNEVMGLKLDSGSVSALETRTEGWIAGLQMAALTMRDREDVQGFIKGFSGTNRYILDYLLEEVLRGQPPEIEAFLLHTSILERLTAPLCEAVLANGKELEGDGELSSTKLEPPLPGQSAAILEYLERANLFLTPLDDERTWFRYHHLFADLLRARLQQAQPYLANPLRLRASTWLERNGYIPEAINQLLAAEEIDKAADLIERCGPARLVDGDPSVMWMADSLPAQLLIERPMIGLYQAWILIIHSRIGQALPLLKNIKQQLTSGETNSEDQWMLTIIHLALAFLAPVGSSSESVPLPDHKELEKIPAEELILRNTADFLYGMSMARRGYIDEAVAVSLKSIQREKESQGRLAIPTLAPFLTRIYLMQGRLHEAAALCREYLDPIKEKSVRFIFTNGSMKIDLGEVLYEWNNLDEAEQYIREGLKANEPWRNIMTDGFGLLALTRVLSAKGDYPGAMQIVDSFESKLRENARPREFDEDFRTLRVRVQLASGDLRNPAEWADRIVLSEDFDLYPEYYRLILARIHLAHDRFQEAEKLLSKTTPLPAPGSRTSKQLEFIYLPRLLSPGSGANPKLMKSSKKHLPWPKRRDISGSFWGQEKQGESYFQPTCGLISGFIANTPKKFLRHSH